MNKHTHWPAVILLEGLCSLNPAHAVSVNTTYIYDALNRLTAVQYSNGESVSYSYDAAGNITQTVVSNPAPAPAPAPTPAPTPTPAPAPAPAPTTGASSSPETLIPSIALWPTLPDDDIDGVPGQVENVVLGPNGQLGDGNGDGVPDSEQQAVTSVPLQNKDGTNVFVTLTIDPDVLAPTAQLRQVEQWSLPTDFPDNIAMPFDLIAFSAENIPVGGLVNFPIYVNGNIPVNGYFKQNAVGAWVNIATAIQTVGTKTRIDFAIRDGGEFDADGIANGTIVDPGGPGFKAEISVCARVQNPLPDFAIKIDPALLVGGVELLLQQVKDVFTAISPSIVMELRDTGKLAITYENTVYPVLPIKLEKASTNEPEGVSFTQDGQVKIVTQDHWIVYFAAGVEDMQSLQQSLRDFNLTISDFNHTDGHLLVAASDSSGQTNSVLPCISARPDILTEPAMLASSPGLYLQPYLENEVANVTVAYHVFTDSKGELRQQAMLPTPADWVSLRNVLEKEGFTAVALQTDGIITATDGNGVVHKAIMSYQVTPSDSSADRVSFDPSVGDINEDGQTDLNVIYPSGDQQVLILFIEP